MNYRKLSAGIFLFTFSMLAACVGEAGACQLAKGEWFEVCVPNGFSSTAGCASAKKKCDSARFLSADKSAYLYIFSPQWAGDRGEYEGEISVKADEKVVSDSTSTKNYLTPDGEIVAEDAITERELVIEKKGLYRRRYHVYMNEITNTVTVTGIKWPYVVQTQEKYMSVYDQFRKSIKQFSD